MKRCTSLVMAFALVFSFLAVAAVAQPHGHGQGGEGEYGPPPPRGGGMGLSGLFSLDLTDEQIEQLQALIEEHQELVAAEREATQEQLEATVEALAAIMEADSFDEAGAYEILVQKAELNLNLQMIRLQFQYQILHEILTDEQREELQNIWLNQAALGSGAVKGQGPGDGLGDCPYL